MLACPKCGSAAKEGHVFCPEDGCRYVEAAPPESPQENHPGDPIAQIKTDQPYPGEPPEPHKTCPTCGKGYDKALSFCTVDGTPLVEADVTEQPDATGESPLISTAVKSGGAIPEDELFPFHDLLDHIDKKNRAHWLKVFKTFKEGKYNLSWNWPSFFFGSLRYCWKGMWIKGIAYKLGTLFFQALLMSAMDQSIFLLTWLGTATFFALMGANDYYLFCLKYRQNPVRGKEQATTGKVITFMSPVLVPILLPMLSGFLRYLF